MTLRLIAGKFKGRVLKTPKTSKTRPTQGMLREAVFNICQNEIENACFLDLFAGSGAMAFEALSRGASHVTLVEKDAAAIACIKENAALLHVAVQLLPFPMQRAVQVLVKEGAKFDLIYVDPPYDTELELDFLAPLLASGGRVFVEERRDPKRETPLCKSSLLHLKETRKFGIALLSIFEDLSSDLSRGDPAQE
jgi:16S rRNA (guanine966-N2)-methyltransferase